MTEKRRTQRIQVHQMKVVQNALQAFRSWRKYVASEWPSLGASLSFLLIFSSPVIRGKQFHAHVAEDVDGVFEVGISVIARASFVSSFRFLSRFHNSAHQAFDFVGVHCVLSVK